MLQHFFMEYSKIFEFLGAMFAFFLTFLLSKGLDKYLPADQGREFAVDGEKSRGKTRGLGIVFVSVFIVIALIFGKVSVESSIYLALIFLGMMTGFLDDAAKVPWGEYKKGALDLIISLLIAVTYLYFNSNIVTLAILDVSFKIPVPLYGFLIVVLCWASINVTNCTDGVDSLSATLALITLTSILMLDHSTVFNSILPIFMTTLVAYLWFNANPSSQLMGDAGSRAMGLVIAIAILQTKMPFMYLTLAGVIIVDGGIGLVKVSLKRFLKISILKNTRTPLHDHARKNLGWSNTQVVIRFAIIQVMVSLGALYLSMII